MRTTRQVRYVLALVAIALLAQSASAQRFGSSRSNSLVSLAANEAVQKDLGVGTEAAGMLRTMSDEYRAAMSKETTALGINYDEISDLPQAERVAKLREVSETTAALTKKLTEDFMPKLSGLLSPDQIGRLRQIQIQAQGADALASDEVASALGLTEDQKKKVAELRADYSRQQQRLDGDYQQRSARSRELNAERDSKALDILTVEQKALLTAMKGVPFDVAQLSTFGRRGKN